MKARDQSWDEFKSQEKKYLTVNPYAFLIFFAIYYVALEGLYFLVPDWFLMNVIHHYGIVQPCAKILSILAPQEGIRELHGMLVSHRASLSVVRGCDGSGVIFLLVSGILAYPTRWHAKFYGIIGALVLIYVFNQARLVGLYFVEAYCRNLFSVLHTYFLPMLFIVVSLLFFIYWSIRVKDSDANSQAI